MLRALRDRAKRAQEAYWFFDTEGGATVERRVPLLPMSRDAVQLERLRRGLALYRLVSGSLDRRTSSRISASV